jgi:hypothetical protein
MRGLRLSVLATLSVLLLNSHWHRGQRALQSTMTPANSCSWRQPTRIYFYRDEGKGQHLPKKSRSRQFLSGLPVSIQYRRTGRSRLHGLEDGGREVEPLGRFAQNAVTALTRQPPANDVRVFESIFRYCSCQMKPPFASLTGGHAPEASLSDTPRQAHGQYPSARYAVSPGSTKQAF